MEKIYFEKENFESVKNKVLNGFYGDKKIFNFLNAYSVYLFQKHKRFHNFLLKKENINFPDGFTISLVLSLKNLKKIKRLKGPSFTENFLKDIDLNKDKKHLFIGLNKEDTIKIPKKFKNLQSKNLFYHEIPIIKKEKYDDNELIRKINVIKPNYIWIGIGNPKQEILANDLIDKINQGFVFNVGAALDYLKDKKNPAPEIYEKIGLEWFYRMITDFKHTFPKVIKSFIGQFYLIKYVGLRK